MGQQGIEEYHVDAQLALAKQAWPCQGEALKHPPRGVGGFSYQSLTVVPTELDPRNIHGTAGGVTGPEAAPPVSAW